MLQFREHSISIMVLYAVALHLVWALLIAVDENAVWATPVYGLYRLIDNPYVLLIVLASAAWLAVAGNYMSALWGVWLLMPQQILLLMSASGALSAIYLAQFADGVVRPRAFIAADQIHIVLAALGHTLAVIAHVRNRIA